jgi:hypothetical protein
LPPIPQLAYNAAMKKRRGAERSERLRDAQALADLRARNALDAFLKLPTAPNLAAFVRAAERYQAAWMRRVRHTGAEQQTKRQRA